MARPKKPKPRTPEQIAAERLANRAQDFARVGLPAESAGLEQQEAIEVRRANRQHVEGARRADAFDALKDGMVPGAYDAARRLERDFLIRRGEGDRGRPTSRHDGEDHLSQQDRMIRAAERIEAVLSRVGPRDAWLLRELIDPPAASLLARPTWRQRVAYVTGETDPTAQGAAVRLACGNLADAYEMPIKREAA
jgi:hypothetical protein